MAVDSTVVDVWAQHLNGLRQTYGDLVPIEQVGNVARALLESSGSSGNDAEELPILYREVAGLAAYIHTARQEISAVDPGAIRDEFLPTATDELDAIVQATETATGVIMDVAEAIEDLCPQVDPAIAESLRDATTRIYEACSFQDITGQRITKVVRVLKAVEHRLDALVTAFSPESLHQPALATAPEGVQGAANFGRQAVAISSDQEGDQALLNGPQADAAAMRQDDIDALLGKT